MYLKSSAFSNFEENAGSNIAESLIEPVNPTRDKQINCSKQNNYIEILLNSIQIILRV